MAAFLTLLAVFGSVILVMFLAYHRMIAVRDGTQSRLEIDSDEVPPPAQYVDAERQEDGLFYGKAMTFDASLSSADKRGAELPDVNQTLQGKR